jgi:phenylacetate-CoA ligase
MGMILNPALECLPRNELEALQGARLRQVVGRVYEHVPGYRRLMDAANVSPGDIAGLADLKRLPFTTKNDLRDHYPFGLLAVPLDQLGRIHASTGTTGKPTVVGYTRNDLATWAELCARCLAMSGARPGQIFQNAYGYGLFTGGLGMHYGAERLGLVVVPASVGNTARQILLLRDLGTEIVACTPSYALCLAEELGARGPASRDLRLKTLLLGAEPWTEEMRAELETRLGVDAVNIYGLSEIMGPGVANECVEAKNGSHVFEDHFIVEVIDPQSVEPLPDGEMGELVFTTLTKEALPLIRFRTRDLASLTREPCRCGRTHARISRIVGRTDDMLIIRGVNVFPSQIETALAGVAHVSVHHQIVIDRPEHLDQLEIQVEVDADLYRQTDWLALQNQAPAAESVQKLQESLRHRLHEVLGLSTKVTLLPPGTLPRSEGGKLQRVLDRRGST